MKIDNEKLGGYTAMGIDELAGIIFDENGNIKSSPTNARKALIVKLEEYYEASGFGNPDTGKLNEMDAFMGCALIMSRAGYPTTRKPSTG